MKLSRIKNVDFDRIERIARSLGIPLDQCPTCMAGRIEVEEGVYGFENGTYRYQSEEHACDCQTQIALRKHYMLAGIPDQYMRLDWEADFRAGNEDMKDKVSTYLSKWASFKLHGLGVEFASPKLGVGKTFGATYIGKELIKRGESVYFIPFTRVISTLVKANPDWEYIEDKMYNSTVLILDEVIPPTTDPQAALFSSKFEELIRNRTDYNRINIITTNMDAEEMQYTYPRPYSLLSAKQIRVVLDGADARQQHVAIKELELAMNEEVAPIT